MAKQRPFLVYLASILVPLVLLVVYYALDMDYPRNDDAYYLDTASQNYTAFLKHGLGRGFWHLYFFRPKPILHPVIGVFFFGLTGGKALLAAVACASFFYLIFITYTWRILARSLEGTRLILATSLLGTIPWIFNNAFSFNSEMALLAAIAPAVYYLLKSEFFSRRSESLLAGLWTAVALCMRPIETIMVAVAPVMLIAWRGQRSGFCSRLELLTCAGVSVLCVAALIYQIHSSDFPLPDQQLSYLLLECTLILPLVVSMRLKPKVSPFVLFFVAFMAVSLAWYAPFANVVHEWVWKASFGDFTKLTGERAGVGRFEFIVNAITAVGTITFVWLALIGSLGGPKNLPRRGTLVLAGVAFLIPILIGSLTYNGDNRYYFSGGYILLLAVAIWALRTNAPFGGLRQGLAVILIVAQALALLIPLRNQGDILYPELRYFTRPFVRESIMLPVQGAASRIVDQLSPFLPQEVPGYDELIICLLQARQNTDLDWVADAPSMSVISRERGRAWHFIRPWPWFDNTTQGRYDRVRKECDYMIALPVESIPFPMDHFMSDVGELVVKRYKAGKLAEDGLEFIAKLEYSGADRNVGELILVKNLKKD